MLFWYNLPNYIVSFEGIRVNKINPLLLIIILICFALFSFFSGCEDKKDKDSLIAVEHTTELLMQKDKDQQKRPETQKKPISAHIPVPTDIFTLSDIQQNKYTLAIGNQKMAFDTIAQPIVILNFFSTWCSPCRAEIPYLSDLQKKYKKKVFIAGIVINDTQSIDTLKQFMNKYHADYFISNGQQNDLFASKMVKELQLSDNFSIPLTVIYKNGNYYTHYEGVVPVEMIDHDIQEAIK